MRAAARHRYSRPSWLGEDPAIHVGVPGAAVIRRARLDAAKPAGHSAYVTNHADGRVEPGHDAWETARHASPE